MSMAYQSRSQWRGARSHLRRATTEASFDKPHEASYDTTKARFKRPYEASFDTAEASVHSDSTRDSTSASDDHYDGSECSSPSSGIRELIAEYHEFDVTMAELNEQSDVECYKPPEGPGLPLGSRFQAGKPGRSVT